MRRGFTLTCIAAMAALAAETEAARQIAALQGTYARRVKSGTVDGDKYTAVDKLTIKRVSDTVIDFSLRLNFFNGHTCSIGGTAEYDASGAFVHRERLDEKRECVLKLVPNAKEILIQDTEEGYCKLLTCGARGGYIGVSFSRNLRQALGAGRAAAKPATTP